MTGLNNMTVLAADDDDRNIFVLEAMLEEFEMNIIIAKNGREAVDLLDANPGVDIVLMDMMMPELNGYDAIMEIREKEAYEHLPIIALTAQAMVGDREKCLEAGATSYVSKPIDVDLLISEMNSLLEKH